VGMYIATAAIRTFARLSNSTAVRSREIRTLLPRPSIVDLTILAE